jgi:hypothetical protein
LGHSDKTHRRCRKSVAADLGDEHRIKASIAFRPVIEIVTEPMGPVELIDQLEQDARPETMYTLDEPPPTQAS